MQARGASPCCPSTSAICTLGQTLARCPRTTLEVGWWLRGFRWASSTVLVCVQQGPGLATLPLRGIVFCKRGWLATLYRDGVFQIRTQLKSEHPKKQKTRKFSYLAGNRLQLLCPLAHLIGHQLKARPEIHVVPERQFIIVVDDTAGTWAVGGLPQRHRKRQTKHENTGGTTTNPPPDMTPQ